MPPTNKLKSRRAQAISWRAILPIHPACELLPPMADAELRELGADIKKRGLQIPITILDGEDGVGRLLDGRSRLDAMELVGLTVVTDGELDPDVLSQHIPGNTDPAGYVLSANLHRRHLTAKQKEDLIRDLLKLNPNQSDRKIGKLAKRDGKTVGEVRKKMEERAEIPHVETRTDSKGRKQPAHKQKPSAGATADTKPPKSTAQAPEAKAPEAKPHESTESMHDGAELARTIDFHLNAVLALCGNSSKWPTPNAAHKERRESAAVTLRTIWEELVELTKPAPRPARQAGRAAA